MLQSNTTWQIPPLAVVPLPPNLTSLSSPDAPISSSRPWEDKKRTVAPDTLGKGPHCIATSNTDKMATDNFKVIIVGGGLAGLVAGHCLSKAGIDFVILEGRAEGEQLPGTTVSVWQQTTRVLDQLGLMDDMHKLNTKIVYKATILPDGSLLAKNNVPSLSETLLGHTWFSMQRPDLFQILESRLPGKDRLLKGKRVSEIDVRETGVRVVCTDGSEFEGSIIMGADGVNSKVRRLLAEKQPLQDKGTVKKSKEGQMKSDYACLIGAGPPLPDTPRDTFFETHGPDLLVQSVVNRGVQYFGIYGKLPATTYERRAFTDADKAEFFKRFGDAHCFPGTTVSDMVARSEWTHMVLLEEGVTDVWYGDRVVLVGDAVHKMTPNLGLGFNMAAMDVVSVTNFLRRELLKAPGAEGPSTAALRDNVFAPYRKERYDNVLATIDVSGRALRAGTWYKPLAKVIDKYIMPLINGDVLLLKLLVVPILHSGVVLDFVEEKGFKEGTKKWKRPRQTAVNEAGINEKREKNGA